MRTPRFAKHSQSQPRSRLFCRLRRLIAANVPMRGSAPRFSLAYASATFAITCALSATAPAIDVTWINLGTGNWTDGANWDGGRPPGPGITNEVAVIDNGGTAVIDGSQNVSAGSVSIADTTGSSGTLQISGGSLTNTFANISIGGSGGVNGGRGVLNQSGGSVVLNAGRLNIGFGSTAFGTYNLSGGSLKTQSQTSMPMAVGNLGTGIFNQSGGTVYAQVTQANVDRSVIQLGRNSGSVAASGTYTLSGGTAAARVLQFGNVVQTSNLETTTSTNTFNLLGNGTLMTNEIIVGNTAPNASNVFNFTGGTLSANTIGLPLINSGGILSPTLYFFDFGPELSGLPRQPISTLTFTGSTSYTQTEAGTLHIDLDDTVPGADFVDIGAGDQVGTATILGNIAVAPFRGFDPALGSTFDVLAADTVTFDAVVTGRTPSGLSFEAAEVVGSDGREVLRLTVVPEPSTCALLLASSVVVAIQRRRLPAVAERPQPRRSGTARAAPRPGADRGHSAIRSGRPG